MTQNGSTAVAVQQPAHPLVAALDERMPALIDMLPGGEEAARRFKRVLIQAVFRNPDLQKCSPTSILSAAMESAAIGIEPTGTLGGAYLVPYGQTATLIIGYRGLIELARRSGEIKSIRAHVVRAGDEFSYRYGSDARVDHVPQEGSDQPLTHVYAIAKLRGGDEQFEVMTREQVEAIRTRSKSGSRGPWQTDYDEMARKTVVRRLIKYLPIAVEARDVIERDDADFEPGAVVARVASKADGVRSRIHERTAALRGEVIVHDPEPSEPDEPEAQTDPEPDVASVPFEPGVGALPGDADVEADASPAPTPVASCTHPTELHEARASGIVCRGCGELMAERASEQPERERPLRERLNARIHADRTHAQAKLLCAAVLGLDPNPDSWSMADLNEDQLATVVGALEANASRPAQRSRRQPASSGRR